MVPTVEINASQFIRSWNSEIGPPTTLDQKYSNTKTQNVNTTTNTKCKHKHKCKHKMKIQTQAETQFIRSWNSEIGPPTTFRPKIFKYKNTKHKYKIQNVNTNTNINANTK